MRGKPPLPISAAARAAIERRWHGPGSAEAVAADYGLDRMQVAYLWHAAKLAGRLPARRRQYRGGVQVARGAQRNRRAAPRARRGHVDERDYSLIGEPIAYSPRIRVPERDPLLSALAAAHGGDPRRSGDDLSAALRAARARPVQP